MAESIEVHEVAPRDGLQNEERVLTVAQKLRLLELLAAARPDSLEVTSFVRPDAVPQLADADELCALIRDAPWRAGLPLYGLVLNLRGWERFRRSGLDGVTAVVGVSQEFSRRNAGMDRERAVAVNRELLAACAEAGAPVRLYLSMAFGGPEDDAPPVAAVAEVAAAFAEGPRPDVLVLADTVGAAGRAEVEAVLGPVLETWDVERLGLHVHDTRGRALQACAAAAELGVRRFDASAGGTGGCPFAPGAAGNLATGALVAWARAAGFASGVDPAALDEAVLFLEAVLGRPLARGAARTPTDSP